MLHQRIAQQVAQVQPGELRQRTQQADVVDQKSVEAMVAQVNHELGPIDMLVNNAGIFEYVTPDTTTLDHWKRTIDVNLTGLY
ncbi:MAG TPA: SDR family NAD(P)-dependent oxidoreductase, partial [Steroidobacteraceae bacterium]|nr:SDR family NAD(P)-dependent oxidoreductase [Steroidobacteraceae bacterium]